MIALKVLGIVTVLSFFSLITGVLLVSSGHLTASVLFVPMSLLGVGQVVMIVHLNVTKRVPDSEKVVWRRNLWRGGPLTAGLYLYTVGMQSGFYSGRGTR